MTDHMQLQDGCRCRTGQIKDRSDTGHKGYRAYVGQDGCRIGQMQDRTDAGHGECWMHYRRDAEQEAAGQDGCRADHTGRMHIYCTTGRTDARQAGQMQDRTHAGQNGCRTGRM